MKAPDPRIMLLYAACLSTMGVLIGATWLLACVFAASLASLVALHAGIVNLVKRLRGFLIIIVFIALLQSVFTAQGQALISIGGVSVLTMGGLLMAADTLLRIGVVIASASIFTLTTSRMMIQGLIQLKVPYEIAFMASVALRFLPVFSEEFRDTVTAIQLRGVDFKSIPVKERVKLYGGILTPVVFKAADRAQKLSLAMELRAFRAYPKRTSRIILRFSARDYLLLAILPLLTAGILTYYYVCL